MARLISGLKWLLIALMALLVISISWQVLSRYLLTEPSVWTEELARFLLIWIGVLGAVYGVYERSHLAIDLWSGRVGSRGCARLSRIQNGTIFVFSALVLTLGGGRLVAITMELEQTSPALGVPMAAVYAILPLSGVLNMLITLPRILRPDIALTGGAHD